MKENCIAQRSNTCLPWGSESRRKDMWSPEKATWKSTPGGFLGGLLGLAICSAF